MLDQNTDRMWYVIGAVIVGAAIIFLVNSSFPQLFASVGTTFERAAEDAMDVIDAPPYNQDIVHNGGPLRVKPSTETNGTWYTLDHLALKELIGKEITVSFDIRNPAGTGGYVDALFATVQGTGIDTESSSASFLMTTDWNRHAATFVFTNETYAQYATVDGLGYLSIRSNKHTDGNSRHFPHEVKNVTIIAIKDEVN